MRDAQCKSRSAKEVDELVEAVEAMESVGEVSAWRGTTRCHFRDGSMSNSEVTTVSENPHERDAEEVLGEVVAAGHAHSVTRIAESLIQLN